MAKRKYIQFFARGILIAFWAYTLLFVVIGVGNIMFDYLGENKYQSLVLFPVFLNDVGVYYETPRWLRAISDISFCVLFLCPCHTSVCFPKCRWSAVVLIVVFSVDAVFLLLCHFGGYMQDTSGIYKLFLAAFEALLVASQVIQLVFAIKEGKRKES